MKWYYLLVMIFLSVTIVSAGPYSSNINQDVSGGPYSSNINQGTSITTFFSNITNLSQMQDVNTPTPLDDEVLTYDSGTSLWISQAAASFSKWIIDTTNGYFYTTGGDTLLFNDTLLNNTITTIATAAAGDNSSWNETFADSLYVDVTGDKITGQLNISNHLVILGNYFIKFMDIAGSTTYGYIMGNSGELELHAVSNPMNFYYGNLGSNLGATMDENNGNWTFSSNVSADYFAGDGSGLTNLNLTGINISGDYIPYTGASANLDVGIYNITAAQFIGNGSQLIGTPETTPAGSTGEIQFNDAGSFGASSALFWDKVNKRLGIGASGLEIYQSVGDIFFDSLSTAGGDRIYFRTSTNGTPITGLTIENSGTAGIANIGINVPNPTALLDVYGGYANSQMNFHSIRNADILIDCGAVNRRATVIFKQSGVDKWALGKTDSDTTGDGSEFFIGENKDSSSPAILIKSGGNVGIGTTTPQNKLNVVGSSNVTVDSWVGDDLFVGDSLEVGGSILANIIGSLADRITKIWAVDIDASGNGNFTGNLYSNYSYSKNQVAQFHRVATATAASADTWYNITYDLEVDKETISNWYNLTDSNSSITINGFEGIIRVQGCIHPYNDDVGNQEASFYARVLVNGIEARCLQRADSKSFKSDGIDTLDIVGTVVVEDGDVITYQWRTTNTNIQLEGDAVFDNPVAASLNFERLSDLE